MKYETKGCLYLRKYPWDTEWSLTFGPPGMDKPCDSDSSAWVKIMDHTLSAVLPDNIDLVTPQVDQIRAQMQELRAKTEEALTQMQGRINSLLAIEHKVSV